MRVPFPSFQAATLTTQICRNLVEASERAGHVPFTVVLRGDSTLRGHFPQEPEVAAAVLGEMDAWLLAPFFLQGGRYTIEDVHYVADGDKCACVLLLTLCLCPIFLIYVVICGFFLFQKCLNFQSFRLWFV
jgi:hypothetical protein